MTNKSLFVVIGLLVLALFAFVLFKAEDPGEVEDDPVVIAEEWVVENAATFSERGGSDLEHVSTEEINEGAYEVTLYFESSFAGYGEVEDDEMNAQVITSHTIVVTVEDEVVTKVITDGTYDEINNSFIEENLDPIEEMKVSIYFVIVDEMVERTESVERTVSSIDYKEQAVLELLEGPTVEEKEKGYSTAINEGVVLNYLSVSDGVAYVDFSEELDASGSAMVTMIREQIEKTLLQFEDVNEVVISIEGEEVEILQP